MQCLLLGHSYWERLAVAVLNCAMFTAGAQLLGEAGSGCFELCNVHCWGTTTGRGWQWLF